MAERWRREDRLRGYRSGEFGREAGSFDEPRDFERGERIRFFEEERGGYGEAPRYEYGRYGGRGPRSDYEYGYGGFQRPYGYGRAYEHDYARTPEAAYPREFGREGFGQVGEYVGSDFERGAERSAFGWREGSKRGLGPKNYARSDERIREDVCDELTEDPILDASEIEVSVSNGEVTLTGTVDDREGKRHAEDAADSILGVKNVQNNLRIEEPLELGTRERGTTSGTAGGNVTGTVAGTTRPTGAREPERV